MPSIIASVNGIQRYSRPSSVCCQPIRPLRQHLCFASPTSMPTPRRNSGFVLCRKSGRNMNENISLLTVLTRLADQPFSLLYQVISLSRPFPSTLTVFIHPAGILLQAHRATSGLPLDFPPFGSSPCPEFLIRCMSGSDICSILILSILRIISDHSVNILVS
jgi:hypothetical protein